MNYKSFNLGDWIGHISGVIEDETTLDGNEMRDLVEFLSTLEQEPRKGHWIYDYTSADGHRTYHCSECGCYIKPKHSEPLNSFNWCSLCGADMREVKE